MLELLQLSDTRSDFLAGVSHTVPVERNVLKIRNQVNYAVWGEMLKYLSSADCIVAFQVDALPAA